MPVNTDRWRRVEELFHAALERPERERGDFLAQACRGDEELLREVRALLGSDRQAEAFIEGPAVEAETESSQALSTGGRLGAYEILGLLGAGGMGEVYRAKDTKLGREVALKVLPAGFARDPGRVSRFQQEARLLASLNHPNIATIHGLEEWDDVRVLVLELVPGQTLAERIAEAPLSVEEALPFFKQMAEAVEAAHKKGIVHRDLKPANIKVTAEGKVKVLDFGLAKALESGAGVVDSSQSPTATRDRTQAGVLLGTAPYMSPEQARGKAVDERTDIWAFGCCLYEALCGRTAFRGETVSDTIAQILEREPNWGRLPRDTPASVRHLLGRCLHKDQERRLQAIGDARIEIEEALSGPVVVRSRPRSIAVLPFLNLSPDPEQEYFADGVTEDVIAQFSKIAALKVISRTSVMVFKKREHSLREIATRLGVETVLEGSVRRAGNKVRIVAQLIDAETDEHLWAETYDRQLTDIFAIQSDVALQIASALEAELSPDERARIGKEPTGNLDAYQLYLKGRHCLLRYTAEGIREGLRHLEQAIEEDPHYALAYTGVANACVIAGMGYGAGEIKPAEAFRRGREAAVRALEIDNELGDAHAWLAVVKFVFAFDWTGAEQGLRRALELDPGNDATYDAYGLMLSALERWDEALEMQRRAQALDPLTAVHSSDIATTLLRAGRFDEALEEARRIVKLEPDFPMGHSALGWAYLKKNMCDEGIVELERAVSLSSDNTMFLGQLGQAHALLGDGERARETLRRLESLSRQRYVPPYHLAYVYAGLGEPEKAIDRLEQAYEERTGGVYGIKGSFLFTPLRSHPRFTALLRKMNLA
jgi:serine/threonine-protein kinase